MNFQEENDFYNQDFPDELSNPKPEPEKEPHFSPNDPRYWDRPESEWEHLRPSHKSRIRLWLTIIIGIILLLLFLYIRYFRVNIEDGVQYGYIERIEKSGVIFKTFEGTLLPYRDLLDPNRVYTRDFNFTAANPSVAADIKRMEIAHKPVRLEFKRYNATLPWRGDSKTIVTSVTPVNPSQLLPPDRQPEYLPNGIQ